MENVAIHEDWRSRFSELAPGLLLFARQWVRSRADAEDIVQDAFVRFWRRNHAIDNRALLYATVRSIALDFIRRNSRRARREAEAVSESEQVLVMKIWNELTFAEIATALNISQNTAASRYRYALVTLKKMFLPQ